MWKLLHRIDHINWTELDVVSSQITSRRCRRTRRLIGLRSASTEDTTHINEPAANRPFRRVIRERHRTCCRRPFEVQCSRSRLSVAARTRRQVSRCQSALPVEPSEVDIAAVEVAAVPLTAALFNHINNIGSTSVASDDSQLFAYTDPLLLSRQHSCN